MATRGYVLKSTGKRRIKSILGISIILINRILSRAPFSTFDMIKLSNALIYKSKCSNDEFANSTELALQIPCEGFRSRGCNYHRIPL